MQTNRFSLLIEGKPDPDGFQVAINAIAEEILGLDYLLFVSKNLHHFALRMELDYHTLNRCKNKDYSYNASRQMLHHKKGNLSPHFFIDFLNKARDCISFSTDDMLRLAYAGGKAYVDSLYETEWFLEKLHKDYPATISGRNRSIEYPVHPFSIERIDILPQILTTITAEVNAATPIVLLGSVGVGKTQIIEQLSKSRKQQEEHKILTAFLNGGSYRECIRSWYEDETRITPSYIVPDKVMISTLQKQIEGKSTLMLIDGVERLEDAELLLSVLKNNDGPVIMTTRSNEIAESFTSVSKNRILIPGFSDELTIQYYEKQWKKSAQKDQESIKTLNRLFRGNPLALHFIFHLARRIGWENAYNALEDPSQSTVAEQLNRAYKPLLKAYDLLESPASHYFCSLGTLPNQDVYPIDMLADLWGLSIGNAAIVASQFEKNFLERAADENRRIEWIIPKHVREIANYISQRLD